SPMLQQLPEGNLESLIPERVPEYNELLLAAAAEESLLDNKGPPYPLVAGQPVGTSVLQSQAVCPFQAFARHRLRALPRQEPVVGLDPAQRGQIVHAALTQLWHHLGTAEADLQSLDPKDNPLIQKAVQESLDEAAQKWPEPLHPFFRQLEASRLHRLLQAFLEMEKEREVPFQVIGQEVNKDLPLGQLTVRVRMDRIDRLADGSLVVLDYKTGATRVRDWLGERPPNPQLPLYLLAQDEPLEGAVAALVFCQLRAGACQFSGLANQEGLLPKVDYFQKYAPEFANWRELIASWREVLTALGERFIQGEAQVDPLPGGCQYCDLPPLCRCHETLPTPMAEEEGA
ncbi:MAG: PD-(D/E)XK nuclease family protein, partial [Magnetococcus sp. XQGC-1]